MQLYKNRKQRKRKKMCERSWLEIYKNGKPHPLHGQMYEITLMFSKSSSIETFRKIEEKIIKWGM